MRIGLFLLCLGLYPCLYAQDTLTQRPHIFSWGMQTHYGTIFAHSEAVENTKGSRPIGLEMNAIWQKISQRVWDNCNCYPKMGLSVGYYNYDNRVLGHSTHLAYFLEPNFKLLKNWDIALRGNIGMAYLTNPYDPIRNPHNQSYSLRFSAYVSLGIGSYWRINSHWRVGTMLNYQHISNGGLKDPNKGINWITGALNVVYIPKPATIPQRIRQPFDKKSPIQTHITTFFSTKTAQAGEKQRHLIVGLYGQASKQVSRLSALTWGVEAYHDASSARRMQMDNVEGNGWRVGILGGHQFLLGKFHFSQQVGLYLYQNNPYIKRWYHRWGVMYFPTPKWGFGFNMKAHAHIANFADLRLTRRLGK